MNIELAQERRNRVFFWHAALGSPSFQDFRQEDDVAPLLQIHRSLAHSFNSLRAVDRWETMSPKSRDLSHSHARSVWGSLCVSCPRLFFLFLRKQPNHSNNSRSQRHSCSLVVFNWWFSIFLYSSFLCLFSYFYLNDFPIFHGALLFFPYSSAFFLSRSDVRITYCVYYTYT